jgi:DNA recombination protein RmuC
MADALLAGTALLSLVAIGLLILVVSRSNQLNVQKAELDRLRPLADEIGPLRERSERLTEIEQRLADTQREAIETERKIATLEAEKAAIEKSHRDRLAELEQFRTELQERFSSLASTALAKSSEQFLQLANERFSKHHELSKNELEKRQIAIRNLVTPLSEKIEKFDQKVGEIEKARQVAYGQINEAVKNLLAGNRDLQGETRRLVQALRAPKTRGRWGEMQLKQVFELSGMTEHVDFTTESSFDTEDSRQRPDAIVNIPGGRRIVVDAKTPLEAYLKALEAETPEDQSVHLKQHAAQIREHVRQLSRKNYQKLLGQTPDFVVMFIPGETFVSSAAEIDPGLLENAFQSKILIASPTTLMALLKSIAYGWQQEKMAQNAAEVQELARTLYERLSVFGDHLEKVGKSLRQTVDNYNKAVGSMEGRVLPSARKFEQLGVVTAGTVISDVNPVESEPRPLTAQEFSASREDSPS